jgi:hypothetical protein
MQTGLTVAFDCPAGWSSTGSGEVEDTEAVRLLPQGEMDACLVVGTAPLFGSGGSGGGTGGRVLQPEALIDEMLAQQPQFRVVRRSPPEQLQSQTGRLHLTRVVGWHGEPKIACGQLITVFTPTESPARAALATFIWYTEKAGRRYAPQAMALFRSMRIVQSSSQSWPPADVVQAQAATAE